MLRNAVLILSVFSASCSFDFGSLQGGDVGVGGSGGGSRLGGTTESGGTISTGGSHSTGGTISTGGRYSAGGTISTGGSYSAGGTTYTPQGGNTNVQPQGGNTNVQPQGGNTYVQPQGGNTSSQGGTTSTLPIGGTTSPPVGGSTSGPPTCTTDLMTLRSGTGFNWIATTPPTCSVQGPIYAYGDGTTCTSPSPISATACTATSCCISGATVVDLTYVKYGCGLGMDLNLSGGTSASKSPYAGSAQGFTVTVTGTVTAGQKIRIFYTSTATPPAGGTAPYKEFTGVGTYSVLFSDVTCPSWAEAAQCTLVSGSGAYSLQVQIVGGTAAGDAVGPFSNVCITSIVPIP